MAPDEPRAGLWVCVCHVPCTVAPWERVPTLRAVPCVAKLADNDARQRGTARAERWANHCGMISESYVAIAGGCLVVSCIMCCYFAVLACAREQARVLRVDCSPRSSVRMRDERDSLLVF